MSYSPRSASRLSAATIERAVSSSTSTIPTSIVLQPSDRAAISVWLPANTSLRRPVWLPRFTTIGRYWPCLVNETAIWLTSPRRGLPVKVCRSSTASCVYSGTRRSLTADHETQQGQRVRTKRVLACHLALPGNLSPCQRDALARIPIISRIGKPAIWHAGFDRSVRKDVAVVTRYTMAPSAIPRESSE
ncbi:Uncharacterised protein [Mycobacteroides abscessus subsp. abscessus]|nr:Uncharacterised protein [Mycobacteroides abscessus subsp. abscessus]